MVLQICSVHQDIHQIGKVLDRLSKSAAGSYPWCRSQAAIRGYNSNCGLESVQGRASSWLYKRSVGFRGNRYWCETCSNPGSAAGRGTTRRLFYFMRTRSALSTGMRMLHRKGMATHTMTKEDGVRRYASPDVGRLSL